MDTHTEYLQILHKGKSVNFVGGSEPWLASNLSTALLST